MYCGLKTFRPAQSFFPVFNLNKDTSDSLEIVLYSSFYTMNRITAFNNCFTLWLVHHMSIGNNSSEHF